MTIGTGDTVIITERTLGGYLPEHHTNTRAAQVEAVTATTFTADGQRFRMSNGAPVRRAERVRWALPWGHLFTEAVHRDHATATRWEFLSELTEAPSS